MAAAADDDGGELRDKEGIRYVDASAMRGVAPPPELLSEAWKDGAAGGGGGDDAGGVVARVAIAAALAAALVAFSQVPIGQDALPEVTSGSTNPAVESPSQIAGRYYNPLGSDAPEPPTAATAAPATAPPDAAFPAPAAPPLQ